MHIYHLAPSGESDESDESAKYRPNVHYVSEFQRDLLNNGRSDIAASITGLLDELLNLGLRIEVILVGGSILRTMSTAADLDCVVFYTLSRTPQDIEFSEIRSRWRRQLLDTTFVPLDVSHLLTMQLVVYYTTLFATDKDGYSNGARLTLLVPNRSVDADVSA